MITVDLHASQNLKIRLTPSVKDCSTDNVMGKEILACKIQKRKSSYQRLTTP